MNFEEKKSESNSIRRQPSGAIRGSFSASSFLRRHACARTTIHIKSIPDYTRVRDNEIHAQREERRSVANSHSRFLDRADSSMWKSFFELNKIIVRESICFSVDSCI